MTTKMTVDVYELTWSDLFTFTDAARGIVEDTSAKVPQTHLDGDQTMATVAFEVEIPTHNWSGPSRSISAHDAQRFAEVLDEIEASDGDARRQLAQLSELRDLLRGV